MESPFTLKLRVRYAECDAQQVVFNARYADYADLVATEYVRAMIGGYQELLAQGLDNQVVKLDISWTGSARFDDVLVLEAKTSHIGNTSFTFSIRVFNQTSNKEIAHMNVFYVMVDASTFEKCSISEQMKGRLKNGASGIVIDQTGQS